MDRAIISFSGYSIYQFNSLLPCQVVRAVLGGSRLPDPSDSSGEDCPRCLWDLMKEVKPDNPAAVNPLSHNHNCCVCALKLSCMVLLSNSKPNIVLQTRTSVGMRTRRHD